MPYGFWEDGARLTSGSVVKLRAAQMNELRTRAVEQGCPKPGGHAIGPWTIDTVGSKVLVTPPPTGETLSKYGILSEVQNSVMYSLTPSTRDATKGFISFFLPKNVDGWELGNTNYNNIKGFYLNHSDYVSVSGPLVGIHPLYAADVQMIPEWDYAFGQFWNGIDQHHVVGLDGFVNYGQTIMLFASPEGDQTTGFVSDPVDGDPMNSQGVINEDFPLGGYPYTWHGKSLNFGSNPDQLVRCRSLWGKEPLCGGSSRNDVPGYTLGNDGIYAWFWKAPSPPYPILPSPCRKVYSETEGIILDFDVTPGVYGLEGRYLYVLTLKVDGLYIKVLDVSTPDAVATEIFPSKIIEFGPGVVLTRIQVENEIGLNNSDMNNAYSRYGLVKLVVGSGRTVYIFPHPDLVLNGLSNKGYAWPAVSDFTWNQELFHQLPAAPHPTDMWGHRMCLLPHPDTVDDSFPLNTSSKDFIYTQRWDKTKLDSLMNPGSILDKIGYVDPDMKVYALTVNMKLTSGTIGGSWTDDPVRHTGQSNPTKLLRTGDPDPFVHWNELYNSISGTFYLNGGIDSVNPDESASWPLSTFNSVTYKHLNHIRYMLDWLHDN